MPSLLRARLPYLLLVVSTLCLDRWTKFLVHSRFSLNETISVIDGFFNITYVRNTGVAFGIFSTISSPVKVVFLSLFTAAAAVVVITYSLRSPVRDRHLQLALAFILGGALGNLYDRVRFGYVIDFIEVYYRDYRWPSFNIADSAITVGVLLLALEIMKHETADRT